MKKFQHFAICAAAGMTCTAAMASNNVRISALYGAGGNASSIYSHDFVELYNSGSSPAAIGGWSVQYASTAGTSWAVAAIPAGATMAPGTYYLIQLASNTGTATPSTLPTPDASSSGINMSATNGKVALVRSTTAIGTTTAPLSCPLPANVEDLVGFGTANCFEGGGAAPAMSASTGLLRNTNGCNDNDQNNANFTVAGAGVLLPRNSASPAFFCPGFTDCNNNGIPDNVDIATGGFADCNLDGIPDVCQLAAGDCNANGILDVCELAGNDCNGNGILDACDSANGILTDVDANGTFDECEGAAVVEAVANATVQPAFPAGAPTNPGGPRAGTNGQAFFNIEGTDNVSGTTGQPFASYGAIRFDVAAAITKFDTLYGAGGWHLTSAWLHFVQSNAAFTFNGPITAYYTGNDTIDFTAGPTTTTFFDNFDTDFADRLPMFSFNFTQVANGQKDFFKFYDSTGGNQPGGDGAAAELNSGAGTLTMVLNPDASYVAATYAGITNAPYRGPSLVLFAAAGGGCPCAADFDGSGGTPDAGDIDAFFGMWLAGDPTADADCSGGTPDATDIDVFFGEWLNGGC